MASDAVFRKAVLGGFNRDDVIKYISRLKEEEEKIARLLCDANEKNQQLLAENQRLKEEVENARREREEIKHHCESEILEINNSNNERTESIKKEYEEKIKNLQTEALAQRSAEERIGSAMIDVRKYADMLIKDSCDKIAVMSDDADKAASSALSRMLDISSGIQAFSDKINSILADIVSENEQLTDELTRFKGSLKTPFDEAVRKLNADLPGE